MKVIDFQEKIYNDKTDMWRFANFSKLKKATFSEEAETELCDIESKIEAIIEDDKSSDRFDDCVVIIDGQVDNSLSGVQNVSVDYSQFETSKNDDESVETSDSVLDSSNREWSGSQLILNLDVDSESSAETRVQKRVKLIIVSSEKNNSVNILINCPEKSESSWTVLEVFPESSSFIQNHQLTVNQSDSSKVSVVYLKSLNESTSSDSYHFLKSLVNLGKDCELKTLDCMENSSFTRHKLTVNFEGEDSTADLFGLGLFKDETAQHTHIEINHKVKNCTSSQLYKHMLFNRAYVEFSGLVSVSVGASGTLSNQSNPNLVFSDDARAYSRPQLNILNDDVQCNHGATVGQIDELSLFYLKSRGISEKEAKVVLLKGFIEDVFNDFPECEQEKRSYLEELRNIL
ncbi:SufD family Fe-S cluster assembly protein [bacterium]|nr:SufD family Fe-S cluster assembly protein [bacterium]